VYWTVAEDHGHSFYTELISVLGSSNLVGKDKDFYNLDFSSHEGRRRRPSQSSNLSSSFHDLSNSLHAISVSRHALKDKKLTQIKEEKNAIVIEDKNKQTHIV
jgi:hypothetical protein